MLAAVDASTAIPVSFTDFLEAPTVAALARIVQRARETPAEPAAPEASPAASDRARCSFAQERLWSLEQLGGASAAYNMPIGVRIRGPLDAGALELALRTLAGRHDALRTTFADEGGSPMQVIGLAAGLELERVDLRECAAPLEEAQRLVDELAGSPLDLARGPLMRAALMRVGEEEHVLELVFHHIICDGWSHVVAMRELGVLYRGVCERRRACAGPTGRPVPRARTPGATAPRRRGPCGATRAVARAPRRRSAAAGPAPRSTATGGPELPRSDASRACAERGLRRNLRLRTNGARHAVRDDARRLLHPALPLQRAAGDRRRCDDRGQARPELDEGIGLFASTVALRADLTGEPSFAELVARVRDVVLWGVAHQDAPFEQLVALLAPERDLSRHPLFQVFCAQVPRAPLPFGDAEPFDARPATSRFDLTLFVEEERDEEIELAWEYSTDLFDRTTVERMARQYLRLLDSALADPGQSIDALALLDARRAAGGGRRGRRHRASRIRSRRSIGSSNAMPLRPRTPWR